MFESGNMSLVLGVNSSPACEICDKDNSNIGTLSVSTWFTVPSPAYNRWNSLYTLRLQPDKTPISDEIARMSKSDLKTGVLETAFRRGGFEMSRNETRLLRPWKLGGKKCMERSGHFKGNDFRILDHRHHKPTIRMVRPP